jgi:tRNA(Arg) A34 adenosine deaminase TadA
MSDYLEMAVNLSRISLKAGQFPAGAVLVTKSGNIYKSDPSLAWYHGECMVIDKAIKAEGAPLSGATMYSSMESCLMCSGKMYWAGINKIIYVIPKSQTDAKYAYEDNRPMHEHTSMFHSPLESINDPGFINEALDLYKIWVKKIEST